MTTPELVRGIFQGVTLLGDSNRPGGVTLAFTERTGGVSTGPFATLDLGERNEDDPAAVAENRRRVLAALGASSCAARLICPHQVHGDRVVCVADKSDDGLRRARALCADGADAVVCTVQDVPVLLTYADCVPIVLVVDGGFAVVHSGWKGTVAKIVDRALQELCLLAKVRPQDVRAYIGPHIGMRDYEVSLDMANEFTALFGSGVVCDGRYVDLGEAIVQTLMEAGVLRNSLVTCDDSTASHTDRFYSYRASGGVCGRHGAIACLFSDDSCDPWTTKRGEEV